MPAASFLRNNIINKLRFFLYKFSTHTLTHMIPRVAQILPCDSAWIQHVYSACTWLLTNHPSSQGWAPRVLPLSFCCMCSMSLCASVVVCAYSGGSFYIVRMLWTCSSMHIHVCSLVISEAGLFIAGVLVRTMHDTVFSCTCKYMSLCLYIHSSWHCTSYTHNIHVV